MLKRGVWGWSSAATPVEAVVESSGLAAGLDLRRQLESGDGRDVARDMIWTECTVALGWYVSSCWWADRLYLPASLDPPESFALSADAVGDIHSDPSAGSALGKMIFCHTPIEPVVLDNLHARAHKFRHTKSLNPRPYRVHRFPVRVRDDMIAGAQSSPLL
ncbi:MAG: hypothetical protein V3V08_04440 [Nannocystaceae bacterium]